MEPVKRLLSTLIGSSIIFLVVFVLYLDSRPDPHVWHLAKLDEEYTASSPIDQVEKYVALEEAMRGLFCAYPGRIS